MPTPRVITFGCRLNTYESEVILENAKKASLDNAIIINTCAVTAEAERQARQAIRKTRRENPDALIMVTGCAAQINPEHFSQMKEVDRVLGNQEKMDVSYFSPEISDRVLVQDIMEVKETAGHLIAGFESKSRAFIEVQNGCDHRCTFCTIPFGRGNNRSTPAGPIIDQIKLLVEKGFQEIVLTGVDITDYGKGLPGRPSLGRLVHRILEQVPELPRLRLSSIDPVEVDETLFEMIATQKRLMPHFHLSLQSGCDLILKRMKRRHLKADVVAFCNQVRQTRPDAVFGADIIVGFPTETQEMFQETLDFVETCQLSYLHVFPYSLRQGTPAARMPQVSRKTIKERAARLRHLGQHQRHQTLTQWLGKKVGVLVEHHGFGYTEHFAPAQLISASVNDKSIVYGMVQRIENDVLQVEIIKEDERV